MIRIYYGIIDYTNYIKDGDTDMEIKKRILRTGTLLMLICVMAFVFTFWQAAIEVDAASGTVSKRFAEVRKDFPNNSKITKSIRIWTVVNDEDGWDSFGGAENGGCNALVTYVTMKIFHEPYVPGAASYKKIGKTTSASNKAALKKLFKKAKKGDVIRLHNGTTDFHYAIFMGLNSKGVKVYEGNYGSRHLVKYNHQWTWSNLRSWRRNGLKYKVSIYRAKNYNKVNSGKAARNLKKGDKFKYKGITYKVTKAGIRNAAVKVVSRDSDAGSTPKAIGINYETSKRLIRFGESDWDTAAIDMGKKIRIRSYKKDKGRYYDEQYFIVK